MPKIPEPPGECLAVNLFDLDRVDPLVRQLMLVDKLDATKSIRVDEDRMDEVGVEFSCDALTAAAALDVVRNEDRALKRYPCRAYLRVATAWERLPHSAVLTKVVGGRCALNPEFFPSARRAVAPKSKRVTF